MKRLKPLFIVIVGALILSGSSCGKDIPENPNVPQVNINLTIDPNSTLFLQLNTVGGWIYLDEVPGIANQIYPPSRGVMVYRQDINIFKAYERQPPNTPWECCDKNNVCTRLVIGNNFPFVKDTCTNTMYNLLDGTIFSGKGVYSLIEYNAFYDGSLLHIHN